MIHTIPEAEGWCINIIGLGGSGKTSLIQDLALDYGAGIFRPSDVLRTYAQANGLTLASREGYVVTHQKIITHDPEAITRPVELRSTPRILVDGLRVISHVQRLRRTCGMFTIALTCPPDMPDREWASIRCARINADRQRRQCRDDVPITDVDLFMQEEMIDRTSTDPNVPNVDLVIASADFSIDATLPSREVMREARRYIDESATSHAH